MNNLTEVIVDLSTKTGVAEHDISRVLQALGLDQSIAAAEDSIVPTALKQVKASDLVVGIKFGRVLVHQ